MYAKISGRRHQRALLFHHHGNGHRHRWHFHRRHEQRTSSSGQLSPALRPFRPPRGNASTHLYHVQEQPSRNGGLCQQSLGLRHVPFRAPGIAEQPCHNAKARQRPSTHDLSQGTAAGRRQRFGQTLVRCLLHRQQSGGSSLLPALQNAENRLAPSGKHTSFMSQQRLPERTPGSNG